jgi:hypothetical protein
MRNAIIRRQLLGRYQNAPLANTLNAADHSLAIQTRKNESLLEPEQNNN